jgi:hypothetical protein
MSGSGLEKMPKLVSVSEQDRQKIFGAIARIDAAEMQRLGAWSAAARIVPEANHMHIEPEYEGVFFDPADRQYVILANVSVGTPDDTAAAVIGATILARDNGGAIEISEIAVDAPEKSAR